MTIGARGSPLEPVPRCTRCRRRLKFNANPDRFTGSFTCRCGVHWWATRFRSGSVRAQLLDDYDGDAALVDELMTRFRLPESIDQPAYWQICLTGHQHYEYSMDDNNPDPHGRSRKLLRGVLAVLRRAAL